MMTLFVGCTALVVLVVSIILAFHPHYEDGVVGKIGLILLALPAGGRVFGVIDNFFTGADFPPINSTALLVWCGLAIFLARHYYRFRRWHLGGVGTWQRADSQVHS